MPLTRSKAKKIKLDADSPPSSLSGTGAAVAGPSQNNVSKKFQIISNSIYKNHDIIRRLGMNGGQAELLHLRQMSKDYHNIINPIYLQHVNKIIKIETDRNAASLYNNPFQRLYRAFNERFGPVYIKVIKNDVNNTVEIQNPHGYKVTEENWTPNIAHIFQRLKLNDIWYILNKPNYKLEGLNPISISHQVSPYISTLDLATLPDLKNLDKVSQFMEKFTNLKTLNIYIAEFKEEADQRCLDAILKGLTPRVSIRLSMSLLEEESNHERVLAKYGSTSTNPMDTNVTIIIEVERIEELQRVLTGNHATLTNVKFNIFATKTNNLVQLENYTSLCLQYQNFIEELELYLSLGKYSYSTFRPQDQHAVRRCLTRLSPILTKFRLDQKYSKIIWDLLTPAVDMNWPNLSDLHLAAYEYPMEILKTAKKLRILHLDINWITCIFHNTSKSPKECVIEYFSHLCELGQLYLYPIVVHHKAPQKSESKEHGFDKSELRALLEDVVSKNAHIIFGPASENDFYAKCKRRT